MPEETQQDISQKEDGRKGEFVRVKKEKLDEMIKRLERLEASASKAQLAKYDNVNREKTSKIVKLLAINGKVIVGWDKMPKNVCEKNERGVWYEDQAVKVLYEDGSSEEMPYVFFTRRYSYIPAAVISETKNLAEEMRKSQGDFTFKVKTDDAEYEIGSLFVN